MSGKRVCKLDGTQLFPNDYSTLKVDKRYGDVYSASKSSSYTIFDKNGTVLFANDSGEEGVSASAFYAYKKDGYGLHYYNFGAKTFSIDGSIKGDWYVSVDNGRSAIWCRPAPARRSSTAATADLRSWRISSKKRSISSR